MKKRLVVWVFFVILSLGLSLEPSFVPGLAPGFAPALMAQPRLGAASIAKGGVSLGEGDPLWALWNDPSRLIGTGMGSVGELAKTSQAWNDLGFMVHRPFGLAEYPGQSAIGSGPTQVLGPTKREIKAQILLRW